MFSLGYPSSSQYDVTAKVGPTATKQQYQTEQQSYVTGQRPTYPQTTNQQEPTNNQTAGVTGAAPSQPAQQPSVAAEQYPYQTTTTQKPYITAAGTQEQKVPENDGK